jgi:hypothetical protein
MPVPCDLVYSKREKESLTTFQVLLLYYMHLQIIFFISKFKRHNNHQLLPLELSTQSVLLEESPVVRPQLNNFPSDIIVSVFRIEIKPIKDSDPFQALVVLRLEKVRVGSLVVHGIGRVVTDHVETLTRDGSLIRHQHAVQVLVVAPSKAEVVEAALGFVHAISRAVQGVDHIGVELVESRKHHSIVRNLTADDKGITTQCPLLALGGVSVLTVFSTSPKKHDLAHIMEKASELEPVRMSSSANPFSSLKQVKFIRKLQVGIGGVL